MAASIKIKDIWLIPNLLSISRIILTPFLAYFIYLGESAYWESLILIITIVLTDFFDGFLARKLNQTSDMGKLLDPIADKVAIAGVGLALLIYRDFPLWFFIMLILRDIIFLVVGIWFVKKKIVMQVNFWGKLTTTLLGVLVFFYVLDVPKILIHIDIALAVISFSVASAIYFKLFYSKIKEIP